MFRSLYLKLAAVLAVLFFGVGLSFVAVIFFSTEMYQQEMNQKLNNKLADQIVSEKILMKDNRVNEENLGEVFHMLMVINPSIEIYLLDREGGILAFSAPPGRVKRKSVDLVPINRWLAKDMSIPLLGDDPRDPKRKKVFTAAPILNQGRLEGYLYVILGGEIYDNIAQKLKGSYILRLSAWLISASLLFALITGLILFAVLTGRLRRLANVLDAFRRGDTSTHLDLRLKKGKYFVDEIDRLGSTFRDMAERIEDQMEKLQRSDTLRRELIANVSHDLRTPLATLQGYIETLLMKENDVTEKERRNYLKIAITHCERLNKLVGELLELAKLESFEIIIQRESFSLSELIQDVIQKFQLAAKEKQIEITTNINEGLPFVEADIGLIERALENLIENAIRYTPHDGTINILLTPGKGNISVQISDSGRGIPEDELPHIFNRFYRLEKGRKTGRGHSGLGLAITKKIFDLHKRSLEVTSASGVGTSFTFQLPIFIPV